MPSGRWLQPYEVLSYDRPTEKTGESNQPVVGAAGVAGAVPQVNGGRRDATLDTSSPLAAGFGRYYNPVPEGLVPADARIVSCPCSF